MADCCQTQPGIGVVEGQMGGLHQCLLPAKKVLKTSILGQTAVHRTPQYFTSPTLVVTLPSWLFLMTFMTTSSWSQNWHVFMFCEQKTERNQQTLLTDNSQASDTQLYKGICTQHKHTATYTGMNSTTYVAAHIEICMHC